MNAASFSPIFGTYLSEFWSSMTKKRLWIFWILLFIIALRLALPYLIKFSANRYLQSNDAITGHIDDVDLHIYRGAYKIRGIHLEIVGEKANVPFFSADYIDVSVLWAALFRGKIVSELYIQSPVLTLVDVKESSDDSERYATIASEKTWLNLEKNFIPANLKVDRIELADGRIALRGISEKTPLVADLELYDVNALVKYLASAGQNMPPVSASAEARVGDKGAIQLDGSIDLYTKKPTFDVDAKIDDLDVMQLDNAIKLYSPIDVEAGKVSSALELKAEEGEVDGYFKIAAEDLKVFSWKEDVKKDNDNFFQVLVDSMVGGVSALLTNRKTDAVATRVPISGSIDEPGVSVLSSVINLIKNAFVKAIDLNVEDNVSLGDDKE